MRFISASLFLLFHLYLSSFLSSVHGHGALTYPPSTRHGGSLDTAGACNHNQCMWFSQFTTIPDGLAPTLNATQYRTYNIHESKCDDRDWSCRFPWRAPGRAPISGSGCGISGGNVVPLFDGGFPVLPYKSGDDAAQVLPAQPPQVWEKGSVQEVAWAMTANHGGGYHYRLCKLDDNGGGVSEECFQRTPLKFAGDKQWLQYAASRVPHAPRYEIPLVKVSEGTFPEGSEWARNPIPACNFCSPVDACGGVNLLPNYTDPSGTVPWGDQNLTYYGGKAWIDQVHCGVVCAGENLRTAFPWQHNGTQFYGRTDGLMCNGQTQFPEPIPGMTSGFVMNHTYPNMSVDAFSIVDKIIVPTDLEEGHYLLSWRWDCEQSMQIWQSCADIQIVASPSGNTPTGDNGSSKEKTYLYIIIGLSVALGLAVLLLIVKIKNAKNHSRGYEAQEDLLLNHQSHHSHL